MTAQTGLQTPPAATDGHGPLRWSAIPSPIGELLLAADGGALVGVWIGEHPRGASARAEWERADAEPVLVETRRQLSAYFDRRLRTFDLPLGPVGTPFQLRVWEQLRAIPYGETTSYGELARRVESPGAARAVGLANGRNPISVVVPCHRVIGSTGRLVGYGGGMARKRTLLDLESTESVALF